MTTAGRCAMLLAVVLGVLLTLVACVHDCEWRYARIVASGGLPLTGGSTDVPDGEICMQVSVLRVETGVEQSGCAPLVRLEYGAWGLGEPADGPAIWDMPAPPNVECVGAYNATWSFRLALPDDWPPEIAAAHPPMVFNLTSDELYHGVEVCLWDGWCPTVEISEH